MGRKSTGKKSGAPEGNFNNLKHGFYSRQLRDLDVPGTKEMENKLEDEVALMRAMLQKYLDLAYATVNHRTMGTVMDLGGRAVIRIANLVRIQEGLRERGGNESLNGILERVLDEMDRAMEASRELEDDELITGETGGIPGADE